ncbi:MAG: transporter substrate-binding domain-containing protein [Deltaproteobacteria bacterium]|nr:transporter substrate-binding domain-containing protein [Deltaproteobacteria bacterium]
MCEKRYVKTRLMYCAASVLVVILCTSDLLWTTPACSQDQPQKIVRNTTGQLQKVIGRDIPTGIIINYDEDLAPLSYSSEDLMKGILVEVLDSILEGRMGLQVEHRGYSGRRVWFMVASGKSDAFCSKDASRAMEYAWVAKTPVFMSSPALFTGVDNPRKEDIGTVSTLAGMRAFSQVDYLGSTWARKTFPRDMLDHIHWVGSLDAAFKLLAINRYDIYVGSEVAGRYALVRTGLTDDIFVRRVSIGKPVTFHFGLRKTYPDAQSIISDVERILKEAESEGTINRIVEKYINPAMQGE